MTEYHVHDDPHGGIPLWDFRYSVCEGPSHGPLEWDKCRLIHVRATRWGARRLIRQHQRRGKHTPFWERPIVDVEP